MSQNVSDYEQQARRYLASRAPVDPSALLALAKSIREEDNNLEYSRRLLDKAFDALDANTLQTMRFQIVRDLVICTYKSPDLPPDERFKKAESLGLRLLNEQLTPAQSQDMLGIMGSIWKQRWRVYGLREHLEHSLRFYKQGMSMGLEMDRGYTAINAAFVLDLLARAGEPQNAASLMSEAAEIRGKVRDVLVEMQAKDTGLREDFWFMATLGEAYLGLRNFDRAIQFMGLAGKNLPALWKIESTARQAAEVARFIALDSGIALEKIVDSDPWKAVQALVGGNSEAALSFLLGKVGLALSGGGFRASLFHIGVLARLAELDVLRHVEVLSCVSGGSIIGAYYYLELRNKLQQKADTPVGSKEALDQEDYLEIVRNIERNFLAGIQRNIRLRMLMEFGSNLQVLTSRHSSMTERLARLYDRELYAQIADEYKGQRRGLSDLLIRPKGAAPTFHPKYNNWTRRHKIPILILNSTTLNTCHNWQFTSTFMGEPPARGIQADIDANDRFRRMYLSEAPPGYRETIETPDGKPIQKSRLKLSDAVAASACVPALFDPLVLDDLYGTTYDPARPIQYVPRLVDGGVYDNQGVSSLLEQDCTVLLVSDACGQTGVALDPGGSRLQVLQRSNNILMARVREAQYQQLASLRDAKALRGLMYVHLKKELESTPVDWIDCPDRSANVTPGVLTSYGMRRDVQLLLARVRTDLDSFSNCEADALMLSGYLMTKSDFNACISGFPVNDCGPQAWTFRQIESIATDSNSSADTAALRNALTVAEQIAFKPFRTFKHLNWGLAIVGLLMLLMLAFLCRRFWGAPTRTVAVPIGKTILTAATVLVILGLLRWALTRLLRYRNAFGQILLSIAMCIFGWVLLRIHLGVWEPIYLRYGPKYRS